ncbi:MAG: Mur ligase family protein [Sphaerochaetaceae bacterium]|nr:Mur ligase family protein [Sphaerochaetaceae bacterium]
MNVLIFGLGVNGGGFAAAKYFLKHNHNVLVTDLKSKNDFGKAINILEKLGAKFRFSQHLVEDFLWADLVVKNASILPNNKYLQYAKKITTDFIYLFENYTLDNIKIIAVTGTKGKTTTTHAINHVLKKEGYNTKLVGNMGISAFEIARALETSKKPIDYLICEFSSWQLRDIFNYITVDFPHTKISLFTNLLEDHQNTYDSMERYLQDKLSLFTPNTEIAICPKGFFNSIKEKTKLKKKNIKFTDDKIVAELQNKPELIPPYKALLALNIKKDIILKHLNSFKGVAHRIEWVGTSDNILFVNDSAATIPEAIEFSMLHFDKINIHLICGGTDKNLKTINMKNSLSKAKSITLLDGSFTQNKLIPFLNKNKIKYNGPFNNMNEAFKTALSIAKEESDINMKAILLSPGAASFDLFINEFDRGNQFKRLAKEIIDKQST